MKEASGKILREHTQVFRSAGKTLRADPREVSGGNGLFKITAERGGKRTFLFSLLLQTERVIKFKSVNNSPRDSFLMETRGSIESWRVCCYVFIVAKSIIGYLGL